MSINKEHDWLMLTLPRLETLSRSHDVSMFCIKKCKKLEMLGSSKATTLRMKILRDIRNIFSFHTIFFQAATSL